MMGNVAVKPNGVVLWERRGSIVFSEPSFLDVFGCQLVTLALHFGHQHSSVCCAAWVRLYDLKVLILLFWAVQRCSVCLGE